MITYLDASALVKRYVAETGSREVGLLIGQSTAVGTAIITRTEVAAALAKSVRMKLLSKAEATRAFKTFNTEWNDLIRLQMTEVLVSQAASLAWEHGLRGYDAVHLAAALFWQDVLGEPVTVATFDRQLWNAAGVSGLVPWPESLS